jgi:hypothetical protein
MIPGIEHRGTIPDGGNQANSRPTWNRLPQFCLIEKEIEGQMAQISSLGSGLLGPLAPSFGFTPRVTVLIMARNPAIEL